MAKTTAVNTDNDTTQLTAHERMQLCMASLSAYYLERSHIVEAIFTSMIAGEHVLIFGPPGTGKSDLIRAVVAHINGARRFEICMTKFTAPEEMFGPFNVPEMMNGRYIRNTDGYLPTAHFGFVDEIWKSSSACANTLLPISNERLFHQEGNTLKCPLITLVGASNELPESKELAALDDRFVTRFLVDYLQPSNRAKLHRRPAGGYTPDVFLDVSEIQQLQTLVPDVTFNDAMNAQFDKLMDLAVAEGLQISDRAMRQAKKMVAAHAVLEGRDFAADDDFEVLADVLWKDPKDRAKAKQLVGKIANPLKAEANAKQDAAFMVYNKLRGILAKPGGTETLDEKKEVMEANGKLRGAMTELNRLIDQHKDGNATPLERAREKVKLMNDNLVRWMQGDPLVEL